MHSQAPDLGSWHKYLAIYDFVDLFSKSGQFHLHFIYPLPGVHQLMIQDDISLFLVLLIELQIEIQYNNILKWALRFVSTEPHLMVI